jgi:DNA-binding CsgD family transcriptional regulator
MPMDVAVEQTQTQTTAHRHLQPIFEERTHMDLDIKVLPFPAHTTGAFSQQRVSTRVAPAAAINEPYAGMPLPLQMERLKVLVADVYTRAQLREWVRGPLRQILPHQHALLAFGRRHSLGIKLDDLVAVDLPESYMNAIQDAPDVLESPALERWFILREPIRISADMLFPQYGAKWSDNFRLHGMRDVIVDGHLLRGIPNVTLLKLYNCSPQVVASLSAIREALFATLNEIWARVAQVEVLTRTDKLRIVSALSPAEKEIIYWLKFGKTNSEIAQILGKSEHTIKTQIHKTLIKTGAVNRTALALLDAN